MDHGCAKMDPDVSKGHAAWPRKGHNANHNLNFPNRKTIYNASDDLEEATLAEVEILTNILSKSLNIETGGKRRRTIFVVDAISHAHRTHTPTVS
jgi:hypothetical protein